MAVQPFHIDIPHAILDDLQARLARARWPDEIEGAGWDYGTNLAYLKELVGYWRDTYDWRAQEATLNQFHHFRADVDGFGIHFIHERGTGANPLPIILTHGWPDSFYRFYKVIPMLTDPARFGGDPADSFDVIVPSIPGFGFSDRPRQPGMNPIRVAELWASLMSNVLGYSKFVAASGDVGRGVTQQLAFRRPDLLLGLHLTDLRYTPMPIDPSTFTEAEKRTAAGEQKWFAEEGAYAMLQRTRPQTLSYGLNDSPVGLAAWIVEKFRAWSDCDGDVERAFSKDELLTNLMIYWVTETINSSVRLYYETRIMPQMKPGERIDVPAGFAIFPKDLVKPAREAAERFMNVQRWTEMPRGGHFPALEEPVLYVEELRAFFRQFR